MSNSGSTDRNGDFTQSLADVIDVACDRFEAAWRSGSEPKIEEFLDQAPQAGRSELFYQLLLVDLHWLENKQQSSTPDDYARRFPDFRCQIEAAFAKLSASRNPDSSLSGPGSTLGRRQGLHLRCPHCHNAVEVVLDPASDSVTCPGCGQAFAPDGEATEARTPPAETATPQRRALGRLQLLEKVGEGAFGVVWKAWDPELKRFVAVKIPRHGQLEPQEVEKFLGEARAPAQFVHPNIVRVYDVGREGDTVYIVSEFIDGPTLVQSLKEHQPSERKAAELCRKIALALDYAHQKGVIHRDLKPGNVMLDAAGEPHIVDFGLAKRQAGEITMTIEGSILGTPAYMSPEQARGEGNKADGRSDVYSLGVVLFEMLTGERPFRGETMMLLMQVIEDDPPPVRRLNSRISRDLETIVAKCLEKPPAKRYATAGDLAEDLARFLRGEPTRARPVSHIEHAWRWCKRNPAVSLLTMAVAAALILGTTVSSYFAVTATAEKNRADKKAAEAETNAQHAQTAEANAEGAAAQAKKAEQTATQSEQESRQSLYYANIGLANRYLQEGDVEPAAEILDRCPGPLRHWEWTFLKGLTERGRRVVLPDTDDGRALFSPDGKWIAAGTVKGDLVLWDDVARRVVLRQKAHSKPIAGIAFSPDGTKLATAGEDNVARVWTVPEGEQAFVLSGHTAALTKGLAFSPDGKWIATASADQTVRIWDAADGKPGRALAIKGMPYDLAWQGKSGLLFVVQADVDKNIVSLWNAVSGKQVPMTFPFVHKDPYVGCGVACSRDGSVVAVAGDHALRAWSIGEGEPVEIFNETFGGWPDVALSADGKTLAAIKFPEDGIVVDLKSKRCVYQIPHATFLRLSSDGARVVAKTGSCFRVLPARVRMETLTLDPVAAKEHVPLSSSPLTLVSTPRAVYHVASGVKMLGVGGRIAADGRRLLSVRLDDWTLQTYDLWSGAVLSKVPLPSLKARFDCYPGTSADGQYVAAADDSDRIHVLDARNGRDVRVLDFDRFVKTIRFAPGDQELAAINIDGWLRVWNWRTGELRKEIPAQTSYHWNWGSLEFSPDGKYLATSGDWWDRTIHVWSWPELRQLHELRGHTSCVPTLAFSHDGKRLLSGSHDGTLRLWDPERGQEILKFEAHQGGNYWVGFSADDQAIVSMDGGATRLWGGLIASVPAGQKIDLLPWLRQYAVPTKSDAGSSGVVALVSSDATVVPIPVAPTWGYVLRGKFTRTRSGANKTVGFLLPAGCGKTMLTFDHDDRATTGLDQVEKHGVGNPTDKANPTNCPVTLRNGQSCTFEARVELQADRAEVTVALNGARIIDWQGPQRLLNMAPHSNWDVPNSRNMGLALGNADVAIEQLELIRPQAAVYLLEPLPTPQRVAPPPGATVVAAPGTVDLLPLVDLEHGGIDVTAKRSESGLDLMSGKSGRVSLPVRPWGNYELSGSFTLPESASPVILVPTKRARGMVHWLIDGVSRFEILQGKDPNDADSPARISPSKVEVGRRHAFRVRVVCEAAQAKLVVELDGEPYMHWIGPESDISLWDGWEIPNQRILGIGVQKGRVTYHELKLKMLDGEAWILKPADFDGTPASNPASTGKPAAGKTPTAATEAKDALRAWTDASGQHRTEAAFAGLTEGQVRLRRPDGTVRTLPLEKLSKADQEWVRRKAMQ